MSVFVANGEPREPYDAVGLADAAREPRALLERVAGSGGRDHGGLRRVEFGQPAQELARVAGEEGAEFIAVGTRGRSRLRAALMGSVSQELLATAPCPVLVVPPGATVGRRSNGKAGGPAASVVCTIDGSSDSQPAAAAAARLARQMNLRLVLMTVYGSRGISSRIAINERRDARERLEVAAAGLLPPIEVDLRTERGDPVSRIAHVASKECAQIIVTGDRPKGQLASRVSASVARTLACTAPAPVLVVTDGGWSDVTRVRHDAPIRSVGSLTRR